MDIIQKIKEELQVEKWQVEAAVKLIDEGNTIPFISRYRKEVTGSLNDEQLRNLDERLTYLRSLEDKKEQVLKSIEEQGKLTDELKEKILAAQTICTDPIDPRERPVPVLQRRRVWNLWQNIFCARRQQNRCLTRRPIMLPKKKK